MFEHWSLLCKAMLLKEFWIEKKKETYFQSKILFVETSVLLTQEFRVHFKQNCGPNIRSVCTCLRPHPRFLFTVLHFLT